MKNNPLPASALFDEHTFYRQFIYDLQHCQREVIIESPFISSARMKFLYPVFESLVNNGVKVYVFTRDPKEHRRPMAEQADYEITRFEYLGVQPFICKGNHHRKLAIIDRTILWEGSLNILSQIKSREIMRRIEDEESAIYMVKFINYEKCIGSR
ncbi:hypothetical protein GYA49_00270 [Candidatus Beckwithbacteria bacterium]|nr:hypothetical protein [Candidatus Beckwithbacteria bacterium]